MAGAEGVKAALALETGKMIAFKRESNDPYSMVCRPEDVTAKAEIPPRCVQEVPFAPARGDGVPLDERHIL